MGILESLFGYQNDPMAQSLTPEQSDTLRGNNIQNLGLAFLKASNTTQGDAPSFGSVLANALGGYGELKNRGLADFVQKQQVLSDINQKQKTQELQNKLINDPQFANDPTAQLLAQSSPGVLGQYLAGQNKANSPMFEKVGNQVVKIDPATGEAVPVYTAPPEEDKLTAYQKASLALQSDNRGTRDAQADESLNFKINQKPLERLAKASSSAQTANVYYTNIYDIMKDGYASGKFSKLTQPVSQVLGTDKGSVGEQFGAYSNKLGALGLSDFGGSDTERELIVSLSTQPSPDKLPNTNAKLVAGGRAASEILSVGEELATDWVNKFGNLQKKDPETGKSFSQTFREYSQSELPKRRDAYYNDITGGRGQSAAQVGDFKVRPK